MILVFGGAYQGKLDYVLERFELTRDDVHFCEDAMVALETDKRVICGFENWLLALVRAEFDVQSCVDTLLPKLADKIVVTTDVSAGIVPLDTTIRAWREEVGRATTKLAQHADEVIRMFVGIPTQIK